MHKRRCKRISDAEETEAKNSQKYACGLTEQDVESGWEDVYKRQVLNRVDDPRFPDTVLEVIEAPYQFSGYDPESVSYTHLACIL